MLRRLLWKLIGYDPWKMQDVRMDFVTITIKDYTHVFDRPCSIGTTKHLKKATKLITLVPDFGRQKWSIVICNEHALELASGLALKTPTDLILSYE